MTQQKAPYPLDYSKTEASTSKDRFDDMAAKATDQFGKAAENAQELLVSWRSRPRRPSKSSSPTLRSR